MNPIGFQERNIKKILAGLIKNIAKGDIKSVIEECQVNLQVR